tara:strand:- start:1370 stop:2443 length:1074 start_codon:yes stop_codon:yes gene_type:complete
MSQTFNLGGLGDNKLTKLIFSNGTANTCSIFLDNDGYLVFEQGANTVTFPLGELPVDKRLAIENGIVVEGRDVVNTGTVGGGDQNQNNLVVSDITKDALTSAVADALSVENLFSAKSEPKPEDGVYPGFANAMYFNGSNYLSIQWTRPYTSQTMTYSFWIKFCDLSTTNTVLWAGTSPSDSSNDDGFDFYQNNARIYTNSGNGSIGSSAAKYMDTSKWYHFVMTADSTNGLRIFANGNPSPVNTVGGFTNINFTNDSSYTFIGSQGASVSLRAYLANIQLIDGQSLDPSAFGQYLQVDGEETNIWIPKPLDPSISYGANGFYLDFSRNTVSGNDITIVHDVAPIDGTHTTANDWTAN